MISKQRIDLFIYSQPTIYPCICTISIIYCTRATVLPPKLLFLNAAFWQRQSHCSYSQWERNCKVHRKTHFVFTNTQWLTPKGRWLWWWWWCDAAVPTYKTHNRCLQVGRWFIPVVGHGPWYIWTIWTTKWRPPECTRNGLYMYGLQAKRTPRRRMRLALPKWIPI